MPNNLPKRRLHTVKKRVAASLVLATSVLSSCQGEKQAVVPVQAVPQNTEIISFFEKFSQLKGFRDMPFAQGSTVSIIKSGQARAEDITQAEIDRMVAGALYKTGDFSSLIKNGQTVVIKPNLVQMKVDSTGELIDKEVSGVTTDWRVTNAVVEQVRKLNPDGKIYIIEGSATGGTKNVMEYLHYTPEFMPEVDGFFALEEDCGAWQDFDAPEIIKIESNDTLLHDEYYFSRMVYEADVLISIPCLKSTSGCVVTGGIKNVSMGLPPGNIYGYSETSASKLNMVSHKMHDGALDKWIYDYFICKPVDYVVVDGLQGFQNGPTPKNHDAILDDRMNMRIIMAGADAVAVDTTCALAMGWDPQSVKYLNHFAQSAVGHTQTERILTLGEPVGGLRKSFSNKFPNLGGVPVEALEPPRIDDLNYSFVGKDLHIALATGPEAVKAELYINSYFTALVPVVSGAAAFDLELAIPAGAEYTAKVVVYDRFMNACEESFVLG